MNLAPLVRVLEDASLGVQGKSLFINMMPSGIDSAILLRSKLSGVLVDHNLPGYYKTDVQVIIRSPNYQSGESLAKEVIKALTMTDTDLGEYWVTYCRPASLPAVFPLSAGNLLEFSCYMSICFVQEE